MLDQYQTVIAKVGTTQGRVLEVVRSAFHVQVRDAASRHTGHVLNIDQAQQLAEALPKAVNR